MMQALLTFTLKSGPSNCSIEPENNVLSDMTSDRPTETSKKHSDLHSQCHNCQNTRNIKPLLSLLWASKGKNIKRTGYPQQSFSFLRNVLIKRRKTNVIAKSSNIQVTALKYQIKA